MRGEAAKAGISEVTQRQGLLRFKLEEFSMEKISALYSREEYKGRLRVDAGSTPAVTLKLRPGKDVTGQAVRCIRDYSAALIQ